MNPSPTTATPTAPRPARAGAMAAGAGSSPRLLVHSPDPTRLSALVRIFEAAGWCVQARFSPIAALERLGIGRYDLALFELAPSTERRANLVRRLFEAGSRATPIWIFKNETAFSILQGARERALGGGSPTLQPSLAASTPGRSVRTGSVSSGAPHP